MKNLHTFADYKFNTELAEQVKIYTLRVLWAEKGIDPATLPQASIMPLIKAEMNHENLIKILDLSGIQMTADEFGIKFGNWYKF